ncbi:hypothetical protein F3Y22_tig00110813pilonHSYRG00179 [Hibiscus syriacus]|uniref:DUS-like FMN-binding domain-containing protein n=1 Tax=Hibiscus syriacus TaxID=106335 RepID=A0A6A2ZN87_HIBSY|nr:hypothetical protein F3Y22_tig00110813pilonHSYRG00179 [Hibiscus syriacus]
MALTQTQTTHSDPPQNADSDDFLSSNPQLNQEEHCSSLEEKPSSIGSPGKYLSGVSRFEREWDHWTKLGQPKYFVAPMVDHSELPFRMLCRKYGAEAAYTPICPQRVASRGYYGAFLMDNLPLVKSLVEKLASSLNVPVSCKIRVFPKLEDTLKYVKMLEDAGCSLLAVHGRTRDEKDGRKFRADWNVIKAVKKRGSDGVLSAETLLENPALFAGFRTAAWVAGNEKDYVDGKLDQTDLVVEYLKLCEKYPVPWRMIRSHVYTMLRDWFRLAPQVREDLNAQSRLTFEFLYRLVDRLRESGVRVPLYQKDNSAARENEVNITSFE